LRTDAGRSGPSVATDATVRRRDADPCVRTFIGGFLVAFRWRKQGNRARTAETGTFAATTH